MGKPIISASEGENMEVMICKMRKKCYFGNLTKEKQVGTC